MIIPMNVGRGIPENFEERVDKACRVLVTEIDRQRGCGFSQFQASVNTEHYFKGGYPMCVIREVGRRFARQGWFVYLVQGPSSTWWTRLVVSSSELGECYVGGRYYKRLKVEN